MQKEELIYTVEFTKPVLYNRFWDIAKALGKRTKTKSAISLWTKFQFYTTDFEDQFNRENCPEEFGKPNPKKKFQVAIPAHHWFTRSMKEVGKKVRVGKEGIRDYIDTAFTITDKRIPVGKPSHLEKPEFVFRGFPPNKSTGTRHIAEMPGFDAGLKIDIHILSLKMIPHEKIKETLELAGFMKGVGGNHISDGFGRFMVVKQEVKQIDIAA